MTIKDLFTLRYLRHLTRTAEGRAFVLTQLADAESNGESAIFDRLRARVEDRELQKMIEKHQADEVRHAQLYREAAERQGVPLSPAPDHLKVIDRLDRAAGGFLGRRLESDRDVMEAYVMLQVIEERGITQFQLLERAFRDVDPRSADTIAGIAADEERHLRYCLAISRRYAPDEATRLATLERYRELEARAFQDNGAATLDYAFSRGLFAGGTLVKAFWRAVHTAVTRSGELPFTSYATAVA